MPFSPTIDKRLAKQKLERIVDELKSEKLFLTCGKHLYVASVKKGMVKPPEPRGCSDCWKAYFFTLHALTAPHLRQEHLDELDEVVRKTVEYQRKGKFSEDFQLYPPGDPRLQVELHKDAADDDTGQDKVVIPGSEGEEKLN